MLACFHYCFLIINFTLFWDYKKNSEKFWEFYDCSIEIYAVEYSEEDRVNLYLVSRYFVNIADLK
jgi:hypothetical protein